MYILERMSMLVNHDIVEHLREADSERQMEEVGIAQELASDLHLEARKWRAAVSP
jgi:hypothetical protein